MFKKLRGMLDVPLDFGLGEFLLVMKLKIVSNPLWKAINHDFSRDKR